MRILLDGDGCPVVDISIKIAKLYKLEVIIVKNYHHEIYDDYATIITVEPTPDSADFYIVNEARKGDIIITQDYGLAAMALSRGAFCINQNGFIIDSENIDGLLNRRYLNQELRRKHKKYSKFKKRNTQADIIFEKNLKNLIESQL
ncbi:YaiI/YqxD family protein [Anaerosalibacter massiliensis]|uniref:UPF0178 protein NSA23_05645 n=1 Tax=Anaerosalibacter massiliensis TaxID=1347392 RepID=A0A9X2MIA6_9FIRM|nr:DUF188 domain-containing protein [Anaerosalibacter massiliensis]MCR2043600.1 DUF188 domain-containing protein [Anaerosalibacter massiliensis]